MSNSRTITTIAIVLASAGILLAAGKVVRHHVQKTREVNTASDISSDHAAARAWLEGEYAIFGTYPCELPKRIEYDGRPYDLARRQYLGYEVSERGDRCELSWSFGPYTCKETLENGQQASRTWADATAPSGK